MTMSPEDRTALADHVIADLALQRAMENPLATVQGSFIYAVPEGWENEEIKADAMLFHPMDAEEFTEALQRGVVSFYIEKGAALTVELIASILERTATNAAVFMAPVGS